LKLHVSRRFLSADLGARLDTSATNWIEFPVKDSVPFRHVQEIVIVEDDKLANDLLERLPVTGPEITGRAFVCRLTLARDFETGMKWFFDTPVGKAVFAGIVLSVAFVLIMGFRGLR